MKKIFAILLFTSLVNTSSFCLSVTSSMTSLTCGETEVTFTFDCNFTGSVLMTTPPASGVAYNNVPITNTPFWDITNGEVTIDIDISDFGNTGNLSINFIVISSNQTCAVPSVDSAMTSISYDCTTPANDDCVNAIPLNLGFNTCSYQNFNTTNTTTSGPVPSCDPTTFVDLWYVFTANNTTITFEYNQNPGTIAFYGIYDACPLNGGMELSCGFTTNTTNTPGSFTLTVPNVNAQYYLQLRFNSFNNGTDQSFCLHTVTPPPPCPTSIVISDAGSNIPSMSYVASDTIQTIGPSTVDNSGVVYDAGKCVLLNSGFRCTTNFEIVMIGCTP